MRSFMKTEVIYGNIVKQPDAEALVNGVRGAMEQ